MPNDDGAFDHSGNPEFDIPEHEFQAAVSPPNLNGRINLRLEYALQQEIENIAEDSQYPLRSVSEVVRYCCLQGIERLRKWKPRPTLLGAIKAANALAIQDKLQWEATELLVRLDERVRWHIDHEHYDDVVDLVAKMRSFFEGTEDSVFRNYIIAEIDKRFFQWQEEIDSKRG